MTENYEMNFRAAYRYRERPRKKWIKWAAVVAIILILTILF